MAVADILRVLEERVEQHGALQSSVLSIVLRSMVIQRTNWCLLSLSNGQI
jgi:hypothetical protein